jgi:hypothetical protein
VRVSSAMGEGEGRVGGRRRSRDGGWLPGLASWSVGVGDEGQ